MILIVNFKSFEPEDCPKCINQKQVNLQINQTKKSTKHFSKSTRNKIQTPFSCKKMNASIVGRYGFRRKSEQRQVALERAWLEVTVSPAVRSDKFVTKGMEGTIGYKKLLQNVDLEPLVFLFCGGC